MYGDNKANETAIDKRQISIKASLLLDQLRNSDTYKDILTSMQTAQEITDALNVLYEQMKG
jgi:hypothetical protein